MSPGAKVLASVVFSVSTTLILMLGLSQLPGLAIPFAYWIFGAACPGVISFVVSLQLVRQSERIHDLQRQRESFLQLLSHDMRAPQASIIALLDRSADSLDPNLAQRIRLYAERTLNLAEDMVQLSRAQQLQYRPEVLNIVDIGRDAVDALAPQARARGIRIEETSAADEILVEGEPSLLARAFINLLDNAVKFSPEQAVVRLDIARADAARQDGVICTVSDSGPGMSEAQLATLYRPFACTGAGGAGLGLAFVRTVVARHGGTIACESRTGCGTTFRVTLPVVADAAAT